MAVPQNSTLFLEQHPGERHFAWPAHFLGTLLLLDHFAGEHFEGCVAQGQHRVYFGVVGSLGALDSCLNFALSPGSSVLVYSFQLSITERQGVRYNFEAHEQLVTFGFRAPITWLGMVLGSGLCRLWNRRYFDYLFKLPELRLPLWPLLG